MADNSVAMIYGVPVKYVSLLILVVQNSALILMMRYSRVQPGPRYLSSTAVVISEALKLAICLVVHLRDQATTVHRPALPAFGEAPAKGGYGFDQLWADIFSARSGFLKVLVPAVLYTLQNNLQFVAASNLDAATFQVTYQCKILTTALFAVMLLGQTLSAKKWVSLLVLTAGIACVQIPSGSTLTTPTKTAASDGSQVVGLVAVAVACICSGFAGVYFEKVLKSTNATSIWVRNIQLSVGCLGIALFGTFVWDGQKIATNGFFQGYNNVVVVTICIQAAGGLIVAMVVKYADNILKGFATSISIILSTIASVFVFNFIITGYFLFGAMLVFLATYLYSQPEAKKNPVTNLGKAGENLPMLSTPDSDDDDEKYRYSEKVSRV